MNKQQLKNQVYNVFVELEADAIISNFKKRLAQYDAGTITADEFINLVTIERVTE